MATLPAAGVALTRYVFDTHALHWHWTGPSKLPPKVRDIVAEADAGKACIVVSHIVLAELYYLFRKLGCQDHFPQRMVELRSSAAFQLEPVLLQDVEQLPNFESVPEMHDRLIAIQAVRLGAFLVTKDPSIQASGTVSCIW